MENLQVKGIQEFMGEEIPVIEGGFGADKKCICDKTIATIHRIEVKHIRERVNQNIKRFKKDIDFIDLKQRVGQTDTLELLQELGYAKQSITQAAHIYLLSERGYAKLIKIMDTDFAWDIHDRLIDEYFTMREIINSDEQLKAKLLLSIYNGGQNGVLASKRLTEIEVKAATMPLLENISKKEKVIEHQDQKLQTQKPFVEFALNVQDSGELFTMEKAAKILSDNSIDIGRNTLMKELRQHKILMENNSPYQKYKNMGLFKCKLVKKENHYGTKIVPATRVTGKGLIFLSKKLREWHGLEKLDMDLEEFDRQVKELQKKRKEEKLENLLAGM